MSSLQEKICAICAILAIVISIGNMIFLLVTRP